MTAPGGRSQSAARQVWKRWPRRGKRRGLPDRICDAYEFSRVVSYGSSFTASLS